MPAKKKKTSQPASKSLESWIWDAGCSIRGVQDAPKYKSFISPLIFTQRVCDVFDGEVNRIVVPDDPEQADWSVIRKRVQRLGEGVTTHLRAISRENLILQGIIDRMDFSATPQGQRDLDDDRLSNLIETKETDKALSTTFKQLGV